MFRHGLVAFGSPRLHRFCLLALPGSQPQLLLPVFKSSSCAGLQFLP